VPIHLARAGVQRATQLRQAGRDAAHRDQRRHRDDEEGLGDTKDHLLIDADAEHQDEQGQEQRLRDGGADVQHGREQPIGGSVLGGDEAQQHARRHRQHDRQRQLADGNGQRRLDIRINQDRAERARRRAGGRQLAARDEAAVDRRLPYAQDHQHHAELRELDHLSRASQA
jgi:hypothetical protein